MFLRIVLLYLLGLKKLYFILFIFLALPIISLGQSSASASFVASVTIIEPIEIRNNANMNFARIDAQGGGSVILNPDNTRSVIGNVKLEKSARVSAAVFEVKGQNGYTYDISIPPGEYVMVNGSKRIILKDFKLSSNSNSFHEDSQIIRMGATIDVEANQKSGRYITPAPLEVTVSYN
ncbi:protein of unknown function [Christiangramia echinicola]|uniref:DUF4402 domain-containing protein n=1 Tax=Christiangramia echinicola TaxID=279359 RepID=A0A1H1RXS5_9FLAO|nr:protein of unknown function [Christiangramia echinicola]